MRGTGPPETIFCRRGGGSVLIGQGRFKKVIAMVVSRPGYRVIRLLRRITRSSPHACGQGYAWTRPARLHWASAGCTRAGALRGQAAIALSRRGRIRSIRKCSRANGSGNWLKKGGRVQRLLWASTSTKNPAYPDLKYVEPLIGPDTVNTLPVETLEAYRDHGAPAPPDGRSEAGGQLSPAPAGAGPRPQSGDPAVGGRRGG